MKKIILLLSFLSCGLSQASNIFKAIAQHDKKAIQAWLKNSPDVALTNDQGQTALMKAVQDGNRSLVKELLNAGASVNAIDRFGRTALDYAVELKDKEVSKILLKHQAMVTNEIYALKCQELLVKRYSRWQKALILLTGGLILLTAGFVLLAIFIPTIMLPCVYTSTGAFLGLVAVELGIGCAACYGVYRWARHAFNKSLDHEIRVLS